MEVYIRSLRRKVDDGRRDGLIETIRGSGYRLPRGRSRLMFRRARIRLTVLYIALFALVLGVFSLVFYVGFATVLAPDLRRRARAHERTGREAAYQATVERIGLALLDRGRRRSSPRRRRRVGPGGSYACARS